jgi:hypothetical protein
MLGPSSSNSTSEGIRQAIRIESLPQGTKSRRVRRGYLDLDGEILKTVLGVAAEGDAENRQKFFADANQGITAFCRRSM